MKNSSRHLGAPAFRPRPLALALASASMLSLLPGVAGAQTAALPTGATVVHGQANIVTNAGTTGSQMTVTNTNNTILNWQTFSIGAGNSVRFEQPNAASQVLNRVIGNDPSNILGSLSSNGRVWLLNSNGILFGASARVDVGGLVASTLNIGNNDWLNARYTFSADGKSNDAAVVNQGELRTTLGGQIALVAGSGGVRNEGAIDASGGQVMLAAGQSVDLVDTGAPNLTLRVTAPAGQAVNLGNIGAAGGRIDLQAAIVNQQGIVRAESLRGSGGTVTLAATDTLTLGAKSSTNANGASGGAVTLDAGNGTLLAGGTVSASGSDGKGGEMKLLGRQVALLDGASVDVSGASGGGQVRVGGGEQGKDASVPNAKSVFISAEASLNADATRAGDGGRVIVWSDDATRAYGRFSAQGGATSGNGGFIETSGGWIDTQGARIDAKAASGTGRAGTWLLDPNNITISTVFGSGPPTTNVTGSPNFTTTNDSAFINTSAINSLLSAGTSVNITTSSAGTNAQFGDIALSNATIIMNGSTPASLTLNAARNITGTASNIFQGSGSSALSVNLAAGTSGNGAVDLTSTSISVAGRIDIGATRTTLGAGSSLSAAGTGNAIVIHGPGATNAAGFIDQTANGALFTPNGRWLIYATDPTSSSWSPSQTPNFKQYNTDRASPTPLAPPATGNGFVFSAHAFITLGGTPTKVYDGSAAINLSSANVNIAGGTTYGATGFISSTPSSASFASKNAGSGNAITFGPSLVSFSDQGIPVYGVDLGTLAGTIAPKALTAVLVTASNKTYDGSTTALLTSNLSGQVGSENFTSYVSGAFDTKDVGANKSVALTYALGGPVNGALASNYTISGPSFTQASITRAPLTVTGVTVSSKIYDGSTTATLTGGTLTGLVAGETFTSFTGNAVFNTKDVGTAKPVSVSYALGGGSSGALASNYTLSGPSGLSGNITPKALGIGAVTAANKPYDGTTAAVLTGGALTGLVGTETFASTLTGSFDTKDAGTGKTVTVGVALGAGSGGALASNYIAPSGTSTTADITPKTLVLSGITAPAKVYDGTVAATLLGGTVSGLVGSESFATNISGVYNNPNAGTNKIVQISYALGAGSNGAVASNYVLTGNTSTLSSITPKLLSLGAAAAADKVYDGTITAAMTAGTLGGLVGAESFAVNASGSFDTKDVGASKTVTYSQTLGPGSNGALAGNYTVPASASGTTTASITPKGLTLTGATAADKVYDGNTVATINGGTLSGLVGNESFSAGGISGAFDTKDAGVNKAVSINVALTNGSNGALASNYSLAGISTTASITPKALVLAGVTAADKVYDGNTAATLSGGTLTGLVGSESFASSATGQFDTKDAGANKAVLVNLALGGGSNGALASNYTFSGTTSTTASIAPKALTFGTATVADKVYDGTRNATFSSGGLTGLVGAETFAVNVAGSFDTKDAGTAKTVTYTRTLGAGSNGALAGNYVLPAATGGTTTASITPKALTFSGATAANKVYDGTTAATVSGGTLGGLVGQESFDASGIAGSFDTKDAGTNKSVAIAFALVNGSNGALASNYTLNGITTQASITPKALSVTGVVAQDKVYDGNTLASVSAGTLVGLVGNESFGTTGVGSFSDKNAGTGKTVAITYALGNGSNGAVASNYTLSGSITSVASITPKALTYTGVSAANKTYDGTTAATLSGGALQGLVGTESFATTASGSFVDKNAGNAKTVTVNVALGAGSNGAQASNYIAPAAQSTTTADIARRGVSVTGLTAANKVYDGSSAATVSGFTLSGVVAGDDLSVSSGNGSFANANVGQAKVVTGQAAGLAGNDRNNYQIVQASGQTTANITPATLVYVATPTRITAGAAIPPLTGSVTGFVAGETVSTATSGSAAFTTPAGSTSPAGSYAINGSGLSAQNYVFTQSAANASALTLSFVPPQLVQNPDVLASLDNALTLQDAITRPTFTAMLRPIDAPPSSRTLDAFTALQFNGADTVSFRTLPVEAMSQSQLATLLSARDRYKKGVFAEAIAKLEQNPELADVGECPTSEQADTGSCLITETQKREIIAARVLQQGTPVAQTPVPAPAAPTTPRPTPAPTPTPATAPAVVARAPTLLPNEVVSGQLERRKISTRAALPQIERKIAILIGSDQYVDARIPKLDNAVGDARAVGELFEKTLGYETLRIENGSKATIIRTLNRLATEVGPRDSVVIYYAGHGELVTATGLGYWQPASADATKPETWLSNADISRLLAQLGASQVALISDSCYSGSLVSNERIRTSNSLDPQQVLARKTVVVMSSGGNEPVFDQGKDGHSPFAYNLMRQLQGVSTWQPGGNVFERVRFAVAKDLPQRPQYGASQQSGHQAGGDYLFEQRQLGGVQ